MKVTYTKGVKITSNFNSVFNSITLEDECKPEDVVASADKLRRTANILLYKYLLKDGLIEEKELMEVIRREKANG